MTNRARVGTMEGEFDLFVILTRVRDPDESLVAYLEHLHPEWPWATAYVAVARPVARSGDWSVDIGGYGPTPSDHVRACLTDAVQRIMKAKLPEFLGTMLSLDAAAGSPGES